jgi:transposase-like protein
VREGGRTVSKAVLVATAVAHGGEREVIGVSVASGEIEACWKAFLEELVGRGLSGVQPVISDAHTGPCGTVRRVLTGTTWQRCYVHYLRNVPALLPKNVQALGAAAFRTAFMRATRETASEFFAKAVAMLEPKHPEAARCARDAEDDVLAYMSFPEAHWRRIRSTNPLERLNKESRRRTDVVGTFPNSAALLRLVTMLLVEQNDEWLEVPAEQPDALRTPLDGTLLRETPLHPKTRRRRLKRAGGLRASSRAGHLGRRRRLPGGRYRPGRAETRAGTRARCSGGC